MIINIFNTQDSLKFSLDRLTPLVKQILSEEKRTCDEVSLYFVDTPSICALHLEYFGDSSTTDCISFPLDEEEDNLSYQILGDVFVCPETAKEYASLHQLDPYEETTLYIVHGLLHLMGYDDQEENDLAQMRKAEQRQMEKIKELDLCLKPL